MGENFKKILLFTAGAAVGSAATWYLLRTKYEQIANEEIESVKEVYSRLTKEKEDELVTAEPCKTEEKPNIMEYASLVRDADYDYSKSKESLQEEPEEEEDDEVPYTIPPDEFGEDGDYDTVSLTYYANNALADDCGVLVDDIDYTVGPDALDSFGEWEDDAVHVKNDRLKTYFEILRVDDEYLKND